MQTQRWGGTVVRAVLRSAHREYLPLNSWLLLGLYLKTITLPKNTDFFTDKKVKSTLVLFIIGIPSQKLDASQSGYRLLRSGFCERQAVFSYESLARIITKTLLFGGLFV